MEHEGVGLGEGGAEQIVFPGSHLGAQGSNRQALLACTHLEVGGRGYGL